MKKRNNSYIGISFIILLFGVWAVPKIVNQMKKSDFATIGKVPPFKFTNQNGKIITNDDYKDKVYVIEFFFTTCPSICPTMMTNMKKVQDEFFGNPNFGIASFTVDPTKDTVEVLKQYALNNGVEHPNWHLLTGTQAQVEKFSKEGLKLYAAQDDTAPGGFEHSGFFVLIDKNGNIRSRYDKHENPIAFYDGLESKSIVQLKEDIKKLLAE